MYEVYVNGYNFQAWRGVRVAVCDAVSCLVQGAPNSILLLSMCQAGHSLVVRRLLSVASQARKPPAAPPRRPPKGRRRRKNCDVCSNICPKIK